MTYANGAEYNGEWKSDMRQGTGTTIYPDGVIYEGHYSKNKRHGQGQMTWKSTGHSYTG